MNIYLDFEATQPEGEIIQIGAVLDNAEKFTVLVKPQFSKVDRFVFELTGLTNEELDNYGIPFDQAIIQLYNWILKNDETLAASRIYWKFYSYGNADIGFLKNSLRNCKNQGAYTFVCQMIATMEDYSKVTKKFFKGSVSLIKAYNYFQEKENKQLHDALQDAKLLAAVAKAVRTGEPLQNYPFSRKKTVQAESANTQTMKMPSGTFQAWRNGKRDKLEVRNFKDIEQAMDFLCLQCGAVGANREKMAIKIMKAVRKAQPYANWYWTRKKEAKTKNE